jgi:hypothetical protein
MISRVFLRVQLESCFIDQVVTQPGTKGLQAGKAGAKAVGHIGGCLPRRCAVVQHDGHNRWQQVVLKFTFFDQVLGQKAHVDHHAQGHPGVGLALELQQQIDPNPLLAHFEPPNHVVMALMLLLTDIAAVDTFQAGEVGLLEPFARHVPNQEVAHHLGVLEQELVAGVVWGGFGHG